LISIKVEGFIRNKKGLLSSANGGTDIEQITNQCFVFYLYPFDHNNDI
jgi:hypothetical protein